HFNPSTHRPGEPEMEYTPARHAQLAKRVIDTNGLDHEAAEELRRLQRNLLGGGGLSPSQARARLIRKRYNRSRPQRCSPNWREHVTGRRRVSTRRGCCCGSRDAVWSGMG